MHPRTNVDMKCLGHSLLNQEQPVRGSVLDNSASLKVAYAIYLILMLFVTLDTSKTMMQRMLISIVTFMSRCVCAFFRRKKLFVKMQMNELACKLMVQQL